MDIQRGTPQHESGNGASPSIVLFAVWIGSLPAWLPLWLNSCRNNPDISFCLITDHPNDVPYQLSNLRVVPGSMDDLRDRFSSVVGFPVSLNAAYKLCEYKPLFGIAYAEYAKGFDFWGHLDIDLFLGRLRAFLPPDMHRYTKVFSPGHLGLYRNDELGNTIYRLPHSRLKWQDVFSSDRYYHFDETRGVNTILVENGVPHFFDERTTADIIPKSARLLLTESDLNATPQCFIYEKGRVLQLYVDGGTVVEREFKYLHFQKRRTQKLDPALWQNIDSWTFTAKGPIPHCPEIRNEAWVRSMDVSNYRHLFGLFNRRLRRKVDIVVYDYPVSF